MSTSSKAPASNRHHGGPGSSHQRPDLPDPTEEDLVRDPDEPERGKRSKVSGGGGEKDAHHTHDNRGKGKGR